MKRNVVVCMHGVYVWEESHSRINNVINLVFSIRISFKRVIQAL